jgi:hypothetical protein
VVLVISVACPYLWDRLLLVMRIVAAVEASPTKFLVNSLHGSRCCSHTSTNGSGGDDGAEARLLGRGGIPAAARAAQVSEELPNDGCELKAWDEVQEGAKRV